MKKTLFLLFTISLVTLHGCESKPFDVTYFIPKTAQDTNVQDVDFNGDGNPEKVIYYKNDEGQHLTIVENGTDGWRIAKKEVFLNNNQPVNRYYHDYQVVDFGNDGKQELFVRWDFERPLDVSYYVATVVNGEYKFLEVPSLDESAYLNNAKGETEIHRNSVSTTDAGIEESYALYCDKDMEDKPMSDRYATSCRDLTLTVKLVNGELVRE